MALLKEKKMLTEILVFLAELLYIDGLIQACARDQKTLGKMLDEMCIMVLDLGLHNDAGVYIEIIKEKFFLN